MKIATTKSNAYPYSKPIEYKRVTPEDFKFGNFDEEPLVNLTPAENGFISEELLEKLEEGKLFDKSDTTIINVGVGQGKTTAGYQIVEHYAKQKKYIVIVVSPLKRLIKRDYEKLSKRPYKVAHYEMAENGKVDEIIDSDIHIVTINTLLQNPGEENLQMTDAKRKYIKGIMNHSHRTKREVVFIFDEIHAGVHNFKQKFIFNLLRWKDYTHKCFVLSATYTEASIVAIEFIGRLTQDNFKIFEAPRQKLPVQADLHLYITYGEYSSWDIKLLRPLAEIIKKEKEAGSRVHIITAHREIALKLTDKKSKDKISKAVNEHLDYQLLTRTEDAAFSKEKSNIGTTFHTGVDINSGSDSLVIIMPSGKVKGTNRFGGIFTDGGVPIIQAIARLRTKGNIHIFLPDDEKTIYSEYYNIIDNIPFEVVEIGDADHHKYEDQRLLLSLFYEGQRKEVEREIQDVEREKIEKNNDPKFKFKAALNYLDFKQFILEDSDQFLVERFECFGRDFSPYVFWATLNDQFANATLQTITKIFGQVEELKLTKANLLDELKQYYGGVERIKEKLTGKPFEQAFRILLDELGSKKDEEGDWVKVKLIYEDKHYITDNSHYSINIKKAIIQILYYIKTGDNISFESEYYLLDRIAGAKFLNDNGYTLGGIQKAYFALSEIRDQMIAYIERNDNKIDNTFITDEMLKELLVIAVILQTNDIFIKSKIFEFVRLAKSMISEAKKFSLENYMPEERKEAFKRMFFRELTNTFFVTTFSGKGTKHIAGLTSLPTESVFLKSF